MIAALSANSKATIAKLIGKVTHLARPNGAIAQVLIGPGRFGTNVPELGVPVTFGEIGPVQVLCEIDTMREGLNPDLSLGTHFFHELAESDMLYVGYVRAREGNAFNQDFFDNAPNRLADLLPDAARWSDVLRVLDFADGRRLHLYANHLEQQALLYFGE